MQMRSDHFHGDILNLLLHSSQFGTHSFQFAIHIFQFAASKKFQREMFWDFLGVNPLTLNYRAFVVRVPKKVVVAEIKWEGTKCLPKQGINETTNLVPHLSKQTEHISLSQVTNHGKTTREIDSDQSYVEKTQQPYFKVHTTTGSQAENFCSWYETTEPKLRT